MLSLFKKTEIDIKKTWTIILLKTSEDWYVNYMHSKLTYQIESNNLKEVISISILNNIWEIEDNITSYGDYINVIEDGEISDNFVVTIYKSMKKCKKDCITYSGIFNKDGEDFVFNQVEETDEEIFLPISQMNPIKKEIISKNVIEYLQDSLISLISCNVDEVLVFMDHVTKYEIIHENNILTNEIKPLSIIITAYQTQDYIEECLDSIENQTYLINNDNFEVLIGIDACKNTFNKIQEIKFKYRNLKVFLMDTNKGTYITSNTLLNLVHYDNIIRFDSDDVMKPEMISEIMKYSNMFDIIRFSFNNFNNNVEICENPFMCANGAIFFKKEVIDFSGGYKNWTISADLELISRIKNKFRMKDIDMSHPLFYRRLHNNSLCARSDTGLNSQMRKQLDLNIREYGKDEEIRIEPEYNTYKLIYSNLYVDVNKYYDKIYCLNLDRRPDKWDIVKEKFDKLNINAVRYSAIDGNELSQEILSKYNKINKYEIGCMLSHYNIIKNAKKNNYKRILILEDDICFAENFNEKFNKFISNIPNNYKLLYLGATQHNWKDIEYENEFYYAEGTDGTFAYSITSKLYDTILNTDEVNNKPIDYKLWDIQKNFYKECFVCYPNIIIADVSDSDIREARNNEETKIKMKWNQYNYE